MSINQEQVAEMLVKAGFPENPTQIKMISITFTARGTQDNILFTTIRALHILQETEKHTPRIFLELAVKELTSRFKIRRLEYGEWQQGQPSSWVLITEPVFDTDTIRIPAKIEFL